MDVSLFLLGALGALLTVYLAKQEVIPEFRPFFDTSETEKEAREHQDHVKKTEKHIDDIQVKMEAESLPEDAVTRLTAVLKTSEVELRDERARLQTLEREIRQSQIISRSLGFLFYIVLGGVFGSLLAGRVKVEGLSGDLPPYFQSIVIGATWTTYLSVIGFSQVGKKVDEKFEALKKEIMEIIESAKSEAEKTGKPIPSAEVAKIHARFDDARMMIQKDVKGIL